jgi:hypothetical protein
MSDTSIIGGMALLSLIYLYPTIIAMRRSHKREVSIAVVNIFLGWTVIGWGTALIWALNEKKADPAGQPSSST